ncbi:MAG: hypothetical protein HND56_08615 [Pseudomonadota bacterium]|nr:MAG: hypothetical protein HND56_08615 [Pseudomonadota bacterium]
MTTSRDPTMPPPSHEPPPQKPASPREPLTHSAGLWSIFIICLLLFLTSFSREGGAKDFMQMQAGLLTLFFFPPVQERLYRNKGGLFRHTTRVLVFFLSFTLAGFFPSFQKGVKEQVKNTPTATTAIADKKHLPAPRRKRFAHLPINQTLTDMLAEKGTARTFTFMTDELTRIARSQTNTEGAAQALAIVEWARDYRTDPNKSPVIGMMGAITMERILAGMGDKDLPPAIHKEQYITAEDYFLTHLLLRENITRCQIPPSATRDMSALAGGQFVITSALLYKRFKTLFDSLPPDERTKIITNLQINAEQRKDRAPDTEFCLHSHTGTAAFIPDTDWQTARQNILSEITENLTGQTDIEKDSK